MFLMMPTGSPVWGTTLQAALLLTGMRVEPGRSGLIQKDPLVKSRRGKLAIWTRQWASGPIQFPSAVVNCTHNTVGDRVAKVTFSSEEIMPEQFWTLLQNWPFTLIISPWSVEDTKPRPEQTLHRICQALTKFPFWIRHQMPPGATSPTQTTQTAPISLSRSPRQPNLTKETKRAFKFVNPQQTSSN
jgi:hypothetical protein